MQYWTKQLAATSERRSKPRKVDMNLSKTTRNGIWKHLLALVASNAVAITAWGQAWEYDEDFTTETSKGAATTADWDTANGLLELGLAQPLTNPAIDRLPMGGNDPAVEDLRDSRGIALGDFDGDGDLDAVVGNEGSGEVGDEELSRNIIYRNVDGAFEFAAFTIGDATDIERTLDIAAADIDNDGDTDIIASNFGGPGVYYLNDGTATLDSGNFPTQVAYSSVNRRTWAVGIADFDGDGDLDILEANSGSSAQSGQVNSLYLNRLLERNNLEFSSEIRMTTNADLARSRALALGDIDNDGDIDVVFGENPVSGGHPGYNTCQRWSGSSFSSPTNIQPTSTFLTFAVKLADVNGDGYLDLIEGNQGAPTHVYLNNMPNSGVACDFQAPQVIGDSNALDTTVAIEVADFNRDGHLDIIEGNNGDRDDDGDETNDLPQPMRLFLNNGDGTFANGLDEVPPKQKVYGTDVGDVDGDGQLDLVSASSDEEQPAGDPLPVEGGNAVYYNLGTPNGSPVQQLFSFAISADDVGNTPVNMTSGSLRFDPFPPALHSSLKYYISNDNGNSWIHVNPLRAVGFPRNGSQLKWRVEMSTLSPQAASLPQVNLLTIADNRPPRFTTGGNSAGSPVEIQAAVGEDLSVAMTSYFSDLEDQRMNFLGTGIPDSLELDPLSGELSGQPTVDDEANSPIDFQVEAFDGLESRTGFFRLSVGGDPNAPSAVDDGPFDVAEGGTLNGTSVLANDSDPNGDTLQAVLESGPANAASFTLNNDGTFVYVHDANSAGTSDSFTYRASDGTLQSNVATVSISITEVDNPPVITLIGNDTIQLNVGDSYVEPGATAADDEDGDISGDIVIDDSAVNTAVAGTYIVTYNVTDSGGNAATEVTRTVIVAAAGVPTIALNGAATVNINVGDSFSDPGATATDAEDGDISSDIVVGGDTVDTATAGTYIITYDVSDSDGNEAATAIRTVIVSAATGGVPTITLNGNASIAIDVGDSFTDPGATASDPEDGDISADIVVSGTVNTSSAGTYTLRYNVTDSDGNAAAPVTRTVTVRAATSPPPSGGGGGGMFGLVDIVALMFGGLIAILRRRRTVTAR
jgi:hypothetical protein